MSTPRRLRTLFHAPFAGFVLGLASVSLLGTYASELVAQRAATTSVGRARPRGLPDCPPLPASQAALNLASHGPASQNAGGAALLPGAAAPLTRQRLNAYEQAGARRLDYLPGEVLVKFKAGMSTARQTRALSALRSRPVASALEWNGPVARFADPTQADAIVMAAQLAEQPEVEFAQPNYIRRMPGSAGPHVRQLAFGRDPAGVPNDPDYRGFQWNLSLINAPGAWDINPGGSASVIVAVLDTGLTVSPAVVSRLLWTGQQFETVPLRFEKSPDLSASRVVLPRDFAFEPAGAMFDFDGHGTHVASTIAEDANNQLSLAGLAYNVRIMPVKVCVGFWELMLQRAALGIAGYPPLDAGGCSDADVAAGIRYAVDNGARVINLSLGGAGTSPAQRDALAYAVSKGAFVSTSMGNGYENGNEVEYPAGYAPGIDGVMSVGAIGKSRARAHYSSTGNHLEVVAPGGSDRDSDGGQDRGYVWQVTLFPPDSDPLQVRVPRFDRYLAVGYTGTSMAAPHVSALAALLMSQGVTSPKVIESAIERFALDLGPAGKDDQYGHGLVQARTSLFGFGLVR
jgi:serine protease